MSRWRVGSFLGDLADNAIDAIDTAIDDAGRKNVRSEEIGDYDAEMASPPPFRGIPYGEHPHIHQQASVQVALVSMSAAQRKLVVAAKIITTIMLALLYSMPIIALFNALMGVMVDSGQMRGIAYINMDLMWLASVMVPLVVVLVLGQRGGMVLGQFIGSSPRNLNLFFTVVGVVGFGVLYSSQFVDRLVIAPVMGYLTSGTAIEVPTSGLILVGLVMIATGFIDEYSGLLLQRRPGWDWLGLVLGLVPALVSTVIFQLTSITVETGLERVSLAVSLFAAALMMIGFVALLMYRFGK